MPTTVPTTVTALARTLGVRRFGTVVATLERDGDAPLNTPVTQAAAFAVLTNPWLGEGVESDLQQHTQRIAPVLAKALSDRLLAVLGGAERIEAFGKGALVGTAGELEHAGALIHTPYFGNLVREFLAGTSVLCFADGRSGSGTSIRVPLWHKTHATRRDYYQTLDVSLADAPHPAELVVIAAASTGPRPHPRIGDRSTDQPITSAVLEGRFA